MNSEMPEEDKWLRPASRPGFCIHDWVDLYGGQGTNRHNRDIALATFFCKKCLKIVTKSYDQSMFKMNPEFEED